MMVLNDVVMPIIADVELGREPGGSSEFSSWCSGHRFLPRFVEVASADDFLRERGRRVLPHFCTD